MQRFPIEHQIKNTWPNSGFFILKKPPGAKSSVAKNFRENFQIPISTNVQFWPVLGWRFYSDWRFLGTYRWIECVSKTVGEEKTFVVMLVSWKKRVLSVHIIPFFGFQFQHSPLSQHVNGKELNYSLRKFLWKVIPASHHYGYESLKMGTSLQGLFSNERVFGTALRSRWKYELGGQWA